MSEQFQVGNKVIHTATGNSYLYGKIATIIRIIGERIYLDFGVCNKYLTNLDGLLPENTGLIVTTNLITKAKLLNDICSEVL